MVTAIIGRQFLAYHNQKHNSDWSAREFFERIFLPVFYDHAKYLMDGGNTALTNPKILKGTSPTPENRQKRFATLSANIEAGYLDTRTTLDFAASSEKEFATSSGQVTDFDLPFDTETAYCSWIGAGFGIGIAGGQVILFNHPQILATLFDGWQHYRDFLNDPVYDNLPGNKITSWNGQWLSHALSDEYREHSPLRGFATKAFTVEPGEEIEIKPQSWLNVLLGIAHHLPLDSLTGYIYKMGKANSTYGFIPFRLGQLQRPEQIYVKLFGEGNYQRDKATIRTLYGSAQSFQRICQMGIVGVSALEPKGLRDLIVSGHGEVKDFKYDATNADNQVTFNTYITWLLAMLNNDESWEEAGQAATLLLQYETVTKRQKDLGTSQSNQIANVLDAAGKRQFMRALVIVMENADVNLLTELEVFAKKIHKLPDDNFPYFQTLVRLRYAKQSREVE